MERVIALFAILLLIGCTSAPAATPTPTTVPTATPTPTPIATPTPTATPAPTPTPLPEEHACMVIGAKDAKNAEAIRDCFVGMNEPVECVYFMLKEARSAEESSGSLIGWPLIVYGKAVDCAKEAEKLPNAAVLPAKLAADLNSYFLCYSYDEPCTVTTQRIDALITALSAVRRDFL